MKTLFKNTVESTSLNYGLDKLQNLNIKNTIRKEQPPEEVIAQPISLVKNGKLFLRTTCLKTNKIIPIFLSLDLENISDDYEMIKRHFKTETQVSADFHAKLTGECFLNKEEILVFTKLTDFKILYQVD